MYQHQPSRYSCRELGGRVDLSGPSYSGTQPQKAISVAEVQLADSGVYRLCSIEAVHELPMMAENSDKIALWLRRQPDAPRGSIPIRRHRWPYYGSEKDLATHCRNLFRTSTRRTSPRRPIPGKTLIGLKSASNVPPQHTTRQSPLNYASPTTSWHEGTACSSEAAFGSTVLQFRGHN